MQTSATSSSSAQYQGQHKRNGSSDSMYVTADPARYNNGKLRRDGAIVDLVGFAGGRVGKRRR